MLTDVSVRSAKSRPKPYKLPDERGLVLEVRPNGGKWWRLRYHFQGKEKMLSLGTFPDVSLKTARNRRDEARRLLADGMDPSQARKDGKAAAVTQAETFEFVAREWHALQDSSWTPHTARTNISRLEKDIFPYIGAKQIKGITAPEILMVLRRVEARGAEETARRLRTLCGQVFRYGIARGRCERDPAADLKGALASAKPKSFASIREPKAIGELLCDLDDYSGNVVVRAALRMAPYVFVRPGELRKAEWEECNFEAMEWRIPAAKMKMRQVHIVPLARQVISILEELRQLTGAGRFLFPSTRARSAPISDMTLLAALRRLGYSKEEMTIHGFRSVASTLLNEQGYNRDWIERQLAHGERNAVRAAYNYAEYLQERHRMMQEWADYLDTLKAGGKALLSV